MKIISRGSKLFNRRLKILHVCGHFYPCTGGIERYVFDLCGELIKRGYQSDVVCLNTCAYSKEILPPKETIDRVSIYRVPYFDLRYYKLAPSVLRLVKGYDIIHVHGTGFFSDYLSLMKIFHRKKMVLSTHGGIFATKNIGALKRIYFNTAVRFALRTMKCIIATGRNDYKIFSRISKNIILIEPGIDYGKFSSIKHKPGKNTFLFVGRISKNKRIDNLIRCISVLKKNIPDIRLFIVGEDWSGLMSEMRALSKRLGVEKNVIFAGKVPDNKLLKYYSISDFFVSASEYEGFGISAVEAMAAGCIPVLNNIEAFRAFIEGGKNGFLVDFSKPEEAARNLTKMLNSPPDAKRRLSSSAKNTAKKYDWGRIAEKIEALYLGTL